MLKWRILDLFDLRPLYSSGTWFAIYFPLLIGKQPFDNINNAAYIVRPLVFTLYLNVLTPIDRFVLEPIQKPCVIFYSRFVNVTEKHINHVLMLKG